MKLSLKIILILFLLNLTTQSYAFDLAHKFGLGIGGGYPIPVWGNTFNNIADPSWGATVYGRYHFDSNLGLEAGVSMSDFKDTNLQFKNINVLGLWRMAGAASLTPLFGIGAGLTDIKNYNPGSAKLSLLGRLGAEFDLSSHCTFGVGADYQYVSKIMGDMPTNPAHVIIPQIMVTWYFGGSDAGTGTQEQATQPEKPKEQVNVSDVVQTKSSSTTKKPDLTIYFDTEKSEIKNEFMAKLKKVAAKIKASTYVSGIIEGHADSTGTRAFNNKLSQERAAAVKRQLVEFGVDENKLQTEGFGEDKPVATNKTKAGRTENRRSAVYISIKEKSDLM